MVRYYKYRLKNKKEREVGDLQKASGKIERVLSSNFGANLRDGSRVYADHFCFSLHVSASYSELREMGRKLRAILEPLGLPFFFVREPLSLYGIVYPQPDSSEFENSKSAEFVEEQAVDLPYDYVERAKRYYSDNSNSNRNELSNSEEILLNYYLELATVSSIIPENPLWSRSEEEELVHVYARHRRMTIEQIETYNRLERLLLVDEDCSPVTGRLGLYAYNYGQDDGYRDVLIIKKVNKLKGKDASRVRKTLNDKYRIDIPNGEAELRKVLSCTKRDDYVFAVKNVGQALATSLRRKENLVPFLYFDYGWPCDPYSVRPSNPILPVSKDTTIILSHLHKDHWFGLKYNIHAYLCSWFIPDQMRKMQIYKKVSEIVAEGGTVSVIRNDISTGLLSITCGALLGIATSDKVYYHKTGNTLRLNAFKEKDRRNILVSGDQMYNSVPTFQKEDIDILVASHHGGDYSETNTMMDIPSASGEGELIYSYGEVNCYGHPSHIRDYISKGWIKRHDTAVDNDYEIEIHF